MGHTCVGVVEPVHDLDDGQLRLLRGTVPGRFFFFVLVLVVALSVCAGGLCVGGALLGAGPEHLLGQLRQLPLQRREAQLLEGGVALRQGQLRDQLLELLR